MIITDNYIKWLINASDDDRGSVYNHSILTISSMRFIDRILIIIEILLGERFCKLVSKDQKTTESIIPDKLIWLENSAMKNKRFEVIDEDGRQYVRYGIDAKFVVQDNKRTIKIFISWG